MFKKKDCECSELKDLLKKHEKQHTVEHYLVMVGLGIVIALSVIPYVI